MSSQRTRPRVWATLCPSLLCQRCFSRTWCCWTLVTSSGPSCGASWLPRFVIFFVVLVAASKTLCDWDSNAWLCLGGGVYAGLRAHSDGGQSREQIQQGRPVCYLCYAEQRLCPGLPHRWNIIYWLKCLILCCNDSIDKQSSFLMDNSVFEHPVEALYGSTYPEYLQYIYLVAPVSLMLLNPIGFALCEVQKWRQTGQSHHKKLDIAGVVILQVCFFFLFFSFFYLFKSINKSTFVYIL